MDASTKEKVEGSGEAASPGTPQSTEIVSSESNGDNSKASEASNGAPKPEEDAAGDTEVFQLTIKLPHDPKSIQIMVSTQEQLQDIRQTIIEFPGTLQYSCFHLEHKGERLNDFIELSEVKDISSDSILTLMEDPYTEKDARLHFMRVRELIGAIGDRTDTVHGLSAGVSLVDAIEPAKPDNENQALQELKPLHPMSDFQFEGAGSLLGLPKSSNSSPPKTVKSISLSPWNPPPYHLRSRGHLLYIQVTTNEGEQHQITGHVGGFYVNKSSNGKFDPFPRPAPKAYAAHSLLTLINEISPSFASAFTSLQEFSNQKDPLANFQLTNAIPASPWFVPASQFANNAHQPDPARSQENYLACGIEDAENLRDWNEEFQSTRELPKETIQEKIFREKLTSKLFADFNEAAARGAVLIARGEVPPLNPTEHQNAQIYVYNNIFFSYGADGVGTFASEGGDEAARAATGRDVSGIRTINQLDVPGLFTPGTAIVDYFGKRIVCQSIVPGIFKQREPDEHQIDYGAVDGRDVIAVDEDFVAPFKQFSQSLRIKAHNVWDKQGKKYHLQGSVETKGLKGTDGRKYVLDLYRLTPLDICWIEDHWKDIPEGHTTKTNGATCPHGEASYPHRMTVLRTELIQDLYRIKAIGYIATKQKERISERQASNAAKSKAIKDEVEGDTSKEETNGNVLPEPESDSKDVQKPNGVATSNGEESNEEPIDMSSFNYALNGDAFTGQVPQTEEDASEWSKDEADVREASQFLRTTVIPRLLHDLKESEVGFPMDGTSLTKLMHKRGINMRYLGMIAQTSSDGGPRLAALKALCIQEMIARAFKHISASYFAELPAYLISPCVSHALNCVLGSDFNPHPKAEGDEAFRTLNHNSNFLFEQLTPTSAQSQVQKEVKRRYQFELDSDWLSQVKHAQLLREISIKIGLQLEAKDYLFKPEATQPVEVASQSSANSAAPPLVNGHVNGGKKKKKHIDRGSPASSVASLPLKTPTTFSPENVVNVVPVIKDSTPRSSLADEAFEAGKLSLSNQQRELGQELLLESLSLHEQIYGVLHPEVARFYINLSMLYYQLDEKAGAAEIARKAAIVAERTLGIDSAETVHSYLNLGLYEHASGNTEQALAFIRHALDLSKIIYGSGHPDFITTANNVAVMLQHLKFYRDSRLWFEATLKVSEQIFGKDSENTATLLFQLAQALVLDGDSKASVNCIRDAYNIFLTKLGPEDRNTKEAESWLEKLTQNAVSVAKHAKDLQARKLRRVQLNPRANISVPRTQPGQLLTDNPTSDPKTTAAELDLSSRNIEELMKFIEGGEGAKRQSPKKKPGRSNPKRRGGAAVAANA